MKVIKQICMILGICLAAEVFASLLPFPFPVSVIAILLLALFLILRIIKEEQIKETADFLLSNMALVFVPISVGVLEDIGVLKGRMAIFLLVTVISLFLTFLGTYASVRIVQLIMQRMKKRKGTSNE